MSSCIDVISKHASIRRYTDEPVLEEHLKAILEATRRAPSAWGLQPYTVIVVKDRGVKEKIARVLGGQEHIVEAPVFLVFTVDYAKLLENARRVGYQVSDPKLGHFIIASIDVGIASAWASLVAEQLGYGVTFIAIYADACRVADILGTPRYVLPVVGLTIGKPAEHPEPRPRQPVEALVSTEKYGGINDKVEALLRDDKIANKYLDVFKLTLAPNGYYDEVSRNLWECLKQRFNIV